MKIPIRTIAMTSTSFLASRRPEHSLAHQFARHAWCLCLFLPLSNVAMLVTGPHTGSDALLWTLPVWLCIAADWFSPVSAYRPPPPLPQLVYTGLLHLLAALQLIAMVLMLRLASELSWTSWPDCITAAANIAAVRVVTGTTSCCSGIALAHELIHRPSRHLRRLGRLILWTVLYDHFAIAHTLAHHRFVATDDDFSTARLNETFNSFWWRSTRGQINRSWQLERERLGDRPALVRFAGNRIIQGLLIQILLLTGIAWAYGWVALGVFVYQAFAATRLLEAVNYFQHWGLRRHSGTDNHPIAWSTRSWFSLHSLLGLPLHTDHHLHANKPFHRLRSRGAGPRLPHGYFVMAILIRVSNRHFQRLAKQELHSKHLLA